MFRMGKASRAKQDPDRRARVAAMQAAEKRRQQRNRLTMAGGAVVAVIVVVALVVVFGMNQKPAKPAGGAPTGAALASVVSNVTSVPASTLDKVGTGSVTTGAKTLTPIKGGAPLAQGGKPEMLYMGAEYCPYCAAERWGMVVALSRFGKFSGLQTTHSSSTDVNPNTPTWTFVNAKYTSKYLAFSSDEMESNVPDPATQSYKPLQKPTAQQQALLSKYDAPPYVPQQDAGSIPFVDFGNKYMLSGASYDGSVLGGKSWAAIASAAKNPSSPIAQGVDGTANYMTAAICKLTSNQPATACTSTVKGLESKL